MALAASRAMYASESLRNRATFAIAQFAIGEHDAQPHGGGGVLARRHRARHSLPMLRQRMRGRVPQVRVLVVVGAQQREQRLGGLRVA